MLTKIKWYLLIMMTILINIVWFSGNILADTKEEKEVNIYLEEQTTLEGVTEYQEKVLVSAIVDDNKIYTYSGIPITPEVIVTNENGQALLNGTDYVVEYRDNVDAGTGQYIVSGIGDYSGEVCGEFIIVPRNISTIQAYVVDQTYNGHALEPVVIAKENNKVLVVGIDYTVQYSNNVNVGNAVVSMKGINNYTGTKKCIFKILEQPTTKVIETTTVKLKQAKIVVKRAIITSVKNSKTKKAKIRWKKISGVRGYQIAYSDNKKFSKKVIYKNINKNTTKTTLKKLRKRIYYIKIRAYKVVNGKKYYGKYSKVKKIKISY